MRSRIDSINLNKKFFIKLLLFIAIKKAEKIKYAIILSNKLFRIYEDKK